MPEKIDDLLPTAKEAQKQIAIKEAEKGRCRGGKTRLDRKAEQAIRLD